MSLQGSEQYYGTMIYVNRLGGHPDSVDLYPLPVNLGIDWQRGPAGWQTSLSLPNIPDGHIIIPSFSAIDLGDYSFQFAISDGSDGQSALNPVPVKNGRVPASDNSSRVIAKIDCWHTQKSLDAPQITLTVRSEQEPVRSLLTVSVRPIVMDIEVDGATRVATCPTPQKISQMQAPQAIANRICSPTALSMLTESTGSALPWPWVVRRCYDPATRAYGSWPLAIHTASSGGLLGAVEAIPSWTTAVDLLQANVAIICSINYAKGALPGAPQEQTGGHLVVLHGLDGSNALVYDPAAPDHASVPRTLPIQAFANAWLRERGAAYILAPLLCEEST